jgi:HK97 family phage portal protein
MAWWNWRREQRSASLSVSDPALIEYFNIGNPNYSGVNIGENSALGLSAVWRAVSLISGTIASLPLRTIREVDGVTTRVSSFLDNPGGPDGPTPYEWKETVLAHLLLHGNAFLAHVFNGGGGLVALVPLHPLAVSVEQWTSKMDMPRPPGDKFYKATLDDGTVRVFTDDTMTHIPGLSMDGLRGLSPISVARNSLGTAVAGDRAAARMFSSGALISGMVSPDDDVEEEDAKTLKAEINRKVVGWENAGDIAFVNRKLKFTPWSMSAEDAQFLQSRQFQIEEVARWYGVPPYELMQTEKQTSWGTGIEAQQRGLARQVLGTWATRIDQRLSRLLPNPRFVEFDFKGLERPTPEQEIDLLLKQVKGGLITVNEARSIMNMQPMTEPEPEQKPESENLMPAKAEGVPQ